MNSGKRLTKSELLDLANFFYSRYEQKKKRLNKSAMKAIIKVDTIRDKLNQ